MGAETRTKLAPNRTPRVCFNEAAPRWARKRPSNAMRERPSRSRFNEAAPRWARKRNGNHGKRGSGAASMRPRHDGRGN